MIEGILSRAKKLKNVAEWMKGRHRRLLTILFAIGLIVGLTLPLFTSTSYPVVSHLVAILVGILVGIPLGFFFDDICYGRTLRAAFRDLIHLYPEER